MLSDWARRHPQAVQQVLGLPGLPGAIQVRMGGMKGMLSLKIDFPADKIGVRPSMLKFASSHRTLEVKRVAKAKHGHPENKLFSQILLILDHLGIPDQVLLGLQKKALADMVLRYDNEAWASIAAVVDGEADPEAARAERMKGYVDDLFERGGKREDGRPMRTAELKACIADMKASRQKINLRCPITLLLGVLDECGVLREGEVLVMNGEVTGPVLICRSPCNHPGDIQRAIAVPRINAMPHIVLDQALVFCALGTRPLADQLAGGDLDGDEFYVVTERLLVDAFHAAPAHDYGSRTPGLAPTKIDVHSRFSVAQPQAPNPADQLEVLRAYMALGDLVGGSADAWVRVVDQMGACTVT